MLLYLSSGHSRRYREDVLRSAGLPKGAVIQFRYDERHLGTGVKGLISTGKVAGNDVLIAYSDQSAKDKEPELYQYHPAKIPVATKIEAASASTRIHFLSDPVLALDSRYDHKEISFETTSGIDAEESNIKINQKNVSN